MRGEYLEGSGPMRVLHSACDDAGLVDPGEIFDKTDDKLTLGQFPQQRHLGGSGVLLVRVSGVLELRRLSTSGQLSNIY